jgi:hypothetical protein
MLFTFEDLETGELRWVIAANEAAARLQLGGIWTDIEAARQEMMAANPMGRGITTPEALAKFTAAQEKHSKLQARREELMRLMIAAGK